MYRVVEMVIFRNFLAFAFVASTLIFAQPANALVVGVAVGAVGDDPDTQSVGLTENRAIGNNAIKYFIPLGTGSGTYGVGGFGTTHDHGFGGGTLSMILAFKPIDPTKNGVLSILFEDLDLIGANDPVNFLESIEIFDQTSTSVAGLITDIAANIITGDANTTQLLSLPIGSLGAGAISGSPTTYYARLDFVASLSGHHEGKNTPEYLIATLDEIPGTISVIPLPASLPLFGTGLAVIGFIGWRRKQQKSG
jgi:hypothetical protein